MKRRMTAALLTMTLLASMCGCTGENDTQTAGSGFIYQTPEMKGEISVNVYETSEGLESAIAMFEDKYPDMKVKLNVFYEAKSAQTEESGMEMGSRPAGQTREDYNAQLNTQLMSGKADDIIITSVGLPLGQYATMGVLEDLSPYLEAAEEINEDDYYMNIFDAYRTASGALYELPISASAVPLFVFEKELLEDTGVTLPNAEAITWREALDLAMEICNNANLPNVCLPDAWGITGDLLTKAIISFVDYESGTIHFEEEKIRDILSIFEEVSYYPASSMSQDELRAYQLRYQPDFEVAGEVILRGSEVRPWKQDDGNVYLSPYFSLDFGINSKSEHKELAWEFLRFLISEEVQSLPSCPYAGVNKAGLHTRVTGSLENWSSELTEEDRNKAAELVDDWVSQITAYRAEDTDLIQISEGIHQSYVFGEISEDEAVAQLQEKLNQYISQ